MHLSISVGGKIQIKDTDVSAQAKPQIIVRVLNLVSPEGLGVESRVTEEAVIAVILS